MARIRIQLPESFAFNTQVEVQISHINYGNHVGNDAFLTICHEARIRYFASMGFNEFGIDGLGIVISDAAVVYKSQAFHGENLDVAVAATDFNRYGCDIVYRISCADREVAHAKTGIVFIDYQTGKLQAAPRSFLAACGEAE